MVGQSIRFTTQAISIDGVYATNYSVSGLPSTAQYSTDVDGNGKTLVSVQWFKPWYGEEKTYPVTFTAYNNVTGASVSQKIYLSVMTPTQPVQTVVTGSMLRNPMLYDRFIVYEDASSGFNKICLYDTLYPSIIDIASSNTYTSPFMVGMDAVYWQDTRTNPASVMKYDISTGALTTVTQGAPAYSGGASYDNATVSVTSNNSGTLTGLKISYDDGLFYTILQNALVSPHPSIYKDRVAYIGRTAQGQMALCLIDLNYTPTITSVEPAGPGNGGLIVINGKHLFGPASGAIWLKSGSVLFTPSVVRAGGDIQQAFFDYDRDIYDPSNLYPPVATYTVTIGNSNADNSVVAHLGKRALTPFISLDTSRWCTNGASLVLTPLSPYSMKIDIALGPVVNSQLIYEIYRCESTNSLYPTPSNLRWTLIKAQDAATYIDTSLQPGTSYSYQVIELLSMVRSYVTTESTLYLPDPANIPMAPSNLYLTGTSTNQIDMTWHDNSNNEAGFRLERSPDGTTGWTQIATPLNNSTSYSDSGLSDGTNYYYRIRATNTAGDSPFSNITMTGTDRINPSNLTALPMEGGNRVVLQWTSALNNRAGFNIYRWTGFAWGTPIASTPATVKTYTDSGLTANTKYYYKVASTNDNRDAKPAPEAMVTTTPANSTQAPVAPSNLIATPASSSQINLSWSDLSNNETGFKIKRKTGAGDFTLFTTASLNSGSYSDTGLVAGTTYAYQVCATNAMGDSGWITSASVTTPQNTQ
ncbi:MAG: fibronectin type III domain-containing protein, partial [Candidatus Omnitrophota bacterium]